MRTHNIPGFNIKMKITLNYPKSAAMGFYSMVLKNEFETVEVVVVVLLFYVHGKYRRSCRDG